jgi:hypothetical protein
MVDQSDPIAASAYPRSSSRDCSSRSSSRMKRGFEAPRVQNRSACPRRSLGSRRAGMRSPLPKTGRGSAPPPPRRRDPLQSTHRVPPRLRRQASSYRPRAAAPQPSQRQRQWVAPQAKRQQPRQKLVPAPATRQVGSRPRPHQQPPPARRPPRRRGQPGELAPWQLVPPRSPAWGHLVRRPANRRGTVRHWLQKPASS